MSQKSLVPTNLLSLSAAPTIPTLRSGDAYYDTTLGAIQVYNGSTWETYVTTTDTQTLTNKTISGASNTITNVSLTAGVTGTLPVANGGTGVTTSTGTGSNVLSTSPSLTTPSIGVATGTSFNSITGLSSTTPNANGTAAVGTGTTTARADHVHPTTGLGLTASGLNQFAATTSAQLAGVISDETGSGSLVFGTSPTITTPTISGNATFNSTTLGAGVATIANVGDQIHLHSNANGVSGKTIILRNDGTDFYILESDANTTPQTATWNSLRPFQVNMTSGLLSSANGQSFSGGTNIASGALTVASVAVPTISSTDTLSNKTLTAPTVNNPLLKSPEERWTVSATAANTTVTFDVSAQGVLYYTAAATANWTLAATNVNTTLAVGDAISIVFANTNTGTAYRPTAMTIDGAAQTVKWSGGTAPSAGNANAVDWFSYVIVKTAATPTYTVFAGQSAKFA